MAFESGKVIDESRVCVIFWFRLGDWVWVLCVFLV